MITGTSKAGHFAMRELPSNPNANKGGDSRFGSEQLRGVFMVAIGAP
jgi:hypothetical protein